MRPQQYHLSSPLTSVQVENIEAMFTTLFKAINSGDVTIDTSQIGSGILPVSNGGTGSSSFTAGSIIFSDGTKLTENNSNLFWDNTNLRWGVGTATPTVTLDVAGQARFSGAFSQSVFGAVTYITNTGELNLGSDNGSSTGGAFLNLYGSTNITDSLAGGMRIGVTGSTVAFTIISPSGNIGVGLTTPTQLVTLLSTGKLAWDDGTGLATDISLQRYAAADLLINLSGTNAQLVLSGPDPGAGSFNPGLVLNNLNTLSTAKNGSVIVGRYGAIASPHNIWELAFGNYGNVTPGVNAMDFVLYGFQTPTGADTQVSRLILGQNGAWIFNPSSSSLADYDPLTIAASSRFFVFEEPTTTGTIYARVNSTTAGGNIGLELRSGLDTKRMLLVYNDAVPEFELLAANGSSKLFKVDTTGTLTTLNNVTVLGGTVNLNLGGDAQIAISGTGLLVRGADTVQLQTYIGGYGTAILINNNRNVSIGTHTGTAALHVKAGTASAGTAPLKFISGSVLSTPEAGAIEFLTDDIFATITTGVARKAFILDDGTRLTSGKIPIATTNGRLIDLTASSAYTPTNVTTDRSYDANATTIDELADVLGTVIADLQAKGILG